MLNLYFGLGLPVVVLLGVGKVLRHSRSKQSAWFLECTETGIQSIMERASLAREKQHQM